MTRFDFEWRGLFLRWTFGLHRTDPRYSPWAWVLYLGPFCLKRKRAGVGSMTGSGEIILTPEGREAFYDAEVAPKLRELGAACEARGMPFVAVVGYDGLPLGSSGRTAYLPAQRAGFFDMMNLAARCWSAGSFNIDAFLTAVCRNARKTGHSSFFLAQLGVPHRPAEEKLPAGGPL